MIVLPPLNFQSCFCYNVVMTAPLRECPLSETEILRYRSYGNGATTLLLLHGLAARSETWQDLLPLFPPERYTIYAVDLLGSGESSKPRKADYSIHAHSERVISFLERLGLAGVTLVGHSLGGAVVLLTSIEAMREGRGDLIASMIVIAGPGFLQRLPLIAEIFQNRLAASLFVLVYAPQAWVKVGLRAAYYDQRLVDRVHIERYAPCYRDREAKRALVETCRSLVPPDQQEIISRYGELQLPVLLLWGRNDSIVPLSQGTRLNAAIPGSKLEVLEHCGHNPQEEKPKETFHIIDRFLGKGEDTAAATTGSREEV
jgi:pimeloyl-ACP methyl ester carboxylesterase